MGIQSINDIVNDLSFKRKFNVNDNVEKPRRKTPAEVDQIANNVCEMIGDYGARVFYCKAAYQLSEDTIYKCVELAKKGRSPVKYLSWLLSHELRSKNASRR